MPAAFTTAPASQTASGGGGRQLIPLAMALFFAFGFCTVVINDTLTPKLKGMFALNYAEAMLTPFVFFIAYFLVSLPAAWLLGRVGYLKTVIAGLSLTAIGALLFTPAATLGVYEAFLGAIFVVASGVTIVQVAANPLTAVIGDPKYSHSRLTPAQAFNSVATMVGPYIGAELMLKGSKPVPPAASLPASVLTQLRIHEAHAMQAPFAGIAVGLILLAGLCALFLKQSPPPPPKAHGTYRSLLTQPRLMLGVLSIFTYVGAEVAIGAMMTSYLMSPHTVGLKIEIAGKLVMFYWGGAMVGRFIGAYVLRHVRPGAVLSFCAFAAAALAATSGLTSGLAAAVAVLAIGLFNSIMFPTIFTLAIEDLGESVPQGSGLLCLAIVGGAVVPWISGTVADTFGLAAFLAVPIVCYLWIAAYGFITRRTEPSTVGDIALVEAG